MLLSFYKIVSRLPIISVGIIASQLAAKGYADQPKNYRKKQQRKSFIYAIINAQFAKHWFDIINSPKFKEITNHRKLLYFKPFRVYMSVNWTKKQKAKVILDTFSFILNKKISFIELVTSNKLFEIACLKLNDTTEGKLTLWYDDRYRKEGELIISFDCNELGGMIVTASFSFEEIEKGNWVCRIACIQGHGGNGENASKTVQKLLHGLRPKALIVFVIQEFSKQLGFSGVYGTGDDIQAYRKKHLIHIPWRHAIKFDYNAIWAECGGILESDGWFKLPLTQIPKNMEDISSNKRSQYRKRYMMLDELSLQIADAVKKLV